MNRSMLALAMCLVLQAPATAAEIPHVSGGIGVAEQEAMKAREQEYSLKLVFTLMEGNYIAGIGVQIKDAAGETLLEHIAAGPFFMARLAPGRYSVFVTYEGRSISRRIEVGRAGLRTEYFRWPSNPLTDMALPAEPPEPGRPAGKSKRR